MPNPDSKDRFEGPQNGMGQFDKNVAADEDLLMEQILQNINTTPIGKVLKRIASLPEVRQKKVLDVRQQLTEGKYRLNERLETVLDRVLEDLTT